MQMTTPRLPCPVYSKFSNAPFAGYTPWNVKWSSSASTTAMHVQYSVAWYDASGNPIGSDEYSVPGWYGWYGYSYAGPLGLC